MQDFIIRDLKTSDIEPELLQVGFDSCYVNTAADKYRYKTLKIYNLIPAQANILKQTALSLGTDCGVHREVITGRTEFSDVILGGSISELKKIAEKLKSQPFSLKILGEKIDKLIKPEKKCKTKLVGILNITPDSFSDGGEYMDLKSAVRHLSEMIEDGADMIDIGAESTRPFSSGVESEEQIKRLKPVLDYIKKENIAIPVSIDTRSSDVANFALDYGLDRMIINDVSGLDFDSKMADVISKYKAGVIIQHSKGTPENMQNQPVYKDIIEEIYLNLRSKIEFAFSKGIHNIIIDPGIGFGKTKDDNYKILNRIEEFYSLQCPVMIGVSRKSLLGVCDNDNGLKDTLSAAISYPLIKSGVDYLRVHNVKLHKQLLSLAE